MAKFVLLHDPLGAEVWVNPEHVGLVRHVLHANAPEGACAFLVIDGQPQMVREHVQDVKNKLESV